MSSDASDADVPPSAQPRLSVQVPEAFEDHDDLESIDSYSLSSSSLGHSTDVNSQILPNRDRTAEHARVDADRADSDPPDLERPNRFKGPASTWRDWTATDRDIAKSLDRLKAQDLSVHLYNAFALRARARKLRAEASEAARLARRDVWEPPKAWTAWPMDANEVPRESATFSHDPFGSPVYPTSARYASASREILEENLLSAFTRKARARFLRRRSLHGSFGSSGKEVEEKPVVLGSDAEEAQRRASGSYAAFDSPQRHSDSASSDGSAQLLGSDVKRQTSRDSISEHGQSTDSPAGEVKMEMKSTQHGEEVASIEESVPTEEPPSGDPHLQAVPLADDQLAMWIAQPSIRHLVSSLENLLHGLKSIRELQRSNIRTSRGRSRRKSRTQEIGSRSISRSHKPLNSIKPTKSLRSRSKYQTSDSSDSEYIGSEAAPSTASSSPSDKEPDQKPQRKASRGLKLNDLQDWSEVLGIAAMQGWDAEAIERARARCSALFDESMGMATLSFEGDDRQGRLGPLKHRRATSEDEMEGGVHVDGFLRPIKRRRGWRGKNKEKGNWKSRQNSEQRRSRSKGKRKAVSESSENEAMKDEFDD